MRLEEVGKNSAMRWRGYKDKNAACLSL